MPQTDFYNHNRFRAYPLKGGTDSLFRFGVVNMRESALVDVGFVMGIDSEYDEQFRVKLTQILITGTVITFTFQDEAASATYDFSFNSTDPFGTIAEVDAVEGAEFGSGFAVAGDLSTLYSEMGVGTHTASRAFYVEEGTVQTLHKHFVKRFSIATQPYTEWHMPADCGGSAGDLWRYRVTGRDLRGHRKFKPGYNATIAVIESQNAIEIGTGIGAGEGEPCDPVEFGSSSLSSCSSVVLSSESSALPAIPEARCKDIFNTINGVWPDALGNFFLTALSPGLTITPYPDTHRIVVEFLSGAYSPFCETEYEGSASSEVAHGSSEAALSSESSGSSISSSSA